MFNLQYVFHFSISSKQMEKLRFYRKWTHTLVSKNNINSCSTLDYLNTYVAAVRERSDASSSVTNKR